MEEWATYKLGEIAECSLGKMLDQRKNKGKPRTYLGNVAVRWGSINIDPTQTMLFEDHELEKYSLKKNDIVICEGGEPGRCAIWKSNDTILIQKALHRVRVNAEIADPLYVYYYITHLAKSHLLEPLFTGSTIKHLPRERLVSIEIRLPDLSKQKQISSILTTIDDKRYTNSLINDNLEQQAQAIYKSWFMDNFQAHWQETSLADVTCKITDGVHNTVIDCPDGEYFLLSCKNIKNGTLDISSTERKINRETFNKLRKRTQLGKGDILLTSVGTIGELMLLNEDPYNFEFQRSVAIIKPNENFISSFFLYGTLKSQIDKIKNTAHGAVQQCIFLSDLKEYSIHIPEFELISQYDQIVKPLFDEKVKREKEIKRLTALRDTLLPKLMSGELKINKIDC